MASQNADSSNQDNVDPSPHETPKGPPSRAQPNSQYQLPETFQWQPHSWGTDLVQVRPLFWSKYATV
jgi:hypothetical protein